MKIVISLGGSVLTKELTMEHFKKYIDTVKLLAKKHKLILVIGGGKVCREYQKIGKQLGGQSKRLDFIGIMSTHINASTFVCGLGDKGYLVTWKPLKNTINEIGKNFGKKIIVCGGYDAGTSSDYDAAYFAKLVKADLLVNVSNVSGVYSEDPKINPNAKKFDKLSHDEFLKIIQKNAQIPGEHRLFDLKAAKLIKKYKIKTILIDGNNPDEIIKAVEGNHSGTVVG
ncbi:MAG: UMP kinase [Candidatus Aenigmatarchaeota archaeon]|nr:UMP kinase [Candidatus Aenigmarchaeota archaeon]